MEYIKPCPICGCHQVTKSPFYDVHGGTIGVRFYCDNCKTFFVYKTKEEAKVWDERPIDNRFEVIEELKIKNLELERELDQAQDILYPRKES